MNISDSSLRDWINSGLYRVPKEGHLSIHLDEIGLVRQLNDLNNYGHIFFQSYSLANSSSIVVPTKIFLVIPFSPVADIGSFIKTLNFRDISSFIDPEEPPSVHLISLETFLRFERCEEYIWPIVDLTLPAMSKDEYNIYIRLFRDLEGIQNCWEYYGGLYFESKFIWNALGRQ